MTVRSRLKYTPSTGTTSHSSHVVQRLLQQPARPIINFERISKRETRTDQHYFFVSYGLWQDDGAEAGSPTEVPVLPDGTFSLSPSTVHPIFSERHADCCSEEKGAAAAKRGPALRSVSEFSMGLPD